MVERVEKEEVGARMLQGIATISEPHPITIVPVAISVAIAVIVDGREKGRGIVFL